jgi:serine/threonine protein kinase/TolB-like protein/Flp pilus assembly protein TadD
MTPERYQRIGQLFDEALELAPEQRAAFLEQACSPGGDADAGLRAEVEKLLANHVGSEGFLSRPALHVAAAALSAQNQFTSLLGQKISHYQILSLLGVGGMGEVYLAEDTQLGRRVALKVLHAELTDKKERLQRLEQEARAASALNHPNILTIYEIGEANDVRFIAAEYVSGETLRECLGRERFTVSEALDIAMQIVTALEAAHQAGIVHRDVKPENVIVRKDGLVKLLDFGIAKLTEKPVESLTTEAPTRVLIKTSPGMVMGTMAYMSPEQVRGQTVDARADEWSLGVILYEMLTGRLPFAGETVSDTIAAILKTEAEPPTNLHAEIPPELERIVLKTLRKNAEERYQHIKDLLIDLRDLRQDLEFVAKLERMSAHDGLVVPSSRRRVTDSQMPPRGTAPNLIRATSRAEYFVREIRQRRRGVLLGLAILLTVAVAGVYFGFSRYFHEAGGAAIDSIAVLPFINQNGDAATEYLQDGLTEGIIISLSRLPQLRAMARSTMFRYKGREVDPQTVGKELGVRAVLTGRIMQQGDNLIISAELVNVADGTQLWGERYSRRTADLLAMQQEIAREISQHLQLRLSGEQERQLNKDGTSDNEAYRLYLKGRYFWNKRTQEGYQQAVEFFQQATDRDPNYALAYVGLADSHAFLRVRGQSGRDAYRKAKTIVQQAIEMDDTLGEAHTTLAMLIQDADWDLAEAEKQYRRAIDLSPNYATAHHWYGELLMQMGRVDEGLAHYQRALEIDPLSPAISSDLGMSYYYARRYDRAIEQLQKTIAMDPSFFRAYFYLARVYEQKGQYEKAIADNQRGFLRLGEPSQRIAKITAALREALAVSGDRGYWRKRLEISNQTPQLSSEWECDIAGIHARLGDKDRAFVELERACQERLFDLLFLKVAPEFDGLRDDPRFQELLKKVEFPQ